MMDIWKPYENIRKKKLIVIDDAQKHKVEV
jgi:hypothetical protein